MWKRTLNRGPTVGGRYGSDRTTEAPLYQVDMALVVSAQNFHPMLLEILRQHVQILVRIQFLCKKQTKIVIAGTSLLSASGDNLVTKNSS